MDHKTRSLAALTDEIATTREHLRRAEEEHAAGREGLVDAGLRLLIAETPIADRDRHRAARVCAELGKRAERLRARLSDLESDKFRIAGKPDGPPVRRTA